MNPFLLAAWIGCQALDGSSTAVALRNPRLVEGNAVLRGPQLYTLKVSVNVGALLWQRQLVTHHPTSPARHVLPLVMATTGCAAGALNLRTIRGVR